MQTAIVTVSKIYPPGEGKKNWAVVGADQQRWSVPPEIAPQIQQGAAVTFAYEDNHFNGKTIHMVKRIEFAGALPAQPQMQTFQAPHQPVAPAPAPHQGNGNGRGNSEDIFVCGVVNHAVAHQSYPTDAASLTQLVRNARHAWRNGQS